MRRFILTLCTIGFAFPHRVEAGHPPLLAFPFALPQPKNSLFEQRKNDAFDNPIGSFDGEQRSSRIWQTCLTASAHAEDQKLASSTCLNETDLLLIKEHLGYIPRNVLSISSRTFHNATVPVAIKCYPLGGGSTRRRRKSVRKIESSSSVDEQRLIPFPTLYWLCNRDISKALSDLERGGYVKLLEERLRQYSKDNNRSMLTSVAECHIMYAKERWSTLSKDDQQLVLTKTSSQSATNMVGMLRDSGVAGTDFRTNTSPSLKCLHAHYAFYRSSSNRKLENSAEDPSSPFLVGGWIHQLLMDTIPDKL